MKIVQLTAENVKRLTAVDITPDEHVQIISGDNAQGKTSVLDAIWLALGGGQAAKSTARPIRDGAKTASVRLDLGDLIVTRTWEGDKTTLKVGAADGSKFSSPQRMLDDLVGRLSFDPLAFTQMTAREQRDALLSLVDLPFDPADMDRRRAGLFEERTLIGRDARAAEGHLASLPAVPDDTPEVEVSSGDLFAELRAAQAQRADHDRVMREAETAQSERERCEEDVAAEQARLEAARHRLAVARQLEADAASAIKALPDLPDTSVLEERIATADQVNAAVRARADRERAAKTVDDTNTRYQAKTQEIEDLDMEKEFGLSSATFPIEGLGFDADGVTYLGVPFSQASSAEQIRVSLAMAMALNPRLRVIRILDGSLLDDKNLALIGEMALANDYQVWIERVTDGSGVGIVIEDGAVAS